MPEMFTFCGRRLQVYKRAHKTCDTVFPIRSRRVQQGVHLATRCDGQAHGGCQAVCLIFWKEAWLKRVEGAREMSLKSSQPQSVNNFVPLSMLGCTEAAVWEHSQARNSDGSLRYVCQATQLPYATSHLAWWDIRQYIEDYVSGNVSLWRIICGVVYAGYHSLTQAGIGLGRPLRWFYNYFHWLWGGTLFPHGTGTIPEGQPTPTASLNLHPGEVVRVKSYKEILQTLTSDNKNRGMHWDAELVPYCGKTFRVKHTVTRIIDERTGKMQQMKSPCIILESVICQSRYSSCRMFCPRSIYSYWREIWLERAESPTFLPEVNLRARADVAEQVSP